uniref:hypothetical protein n=1 Tax=Salmonella sp. SAL4450 TaxID=3159905 RepID=UPI00397A536B
LLGWREFFRERRKCRCHKLVAKDGGINRRCKHADDLACCREAVSSFLSQAEPLLRLPKRA